MSEGIETYRGTVYRWEVDNVDHFTVAYYFQRFDDATAALLGALSVDQKTSPSGAWVPGAARVRYLRELRVGDILHIRSGVLEADRRSVLVAHRLFDSASGELCTTAEMRMTLQDDAGRSLPLPVEAERAAATLGVAWERSPDGEAPQMRPGALFVDAVRDRVRPDEAGTAGRAALAAYVHRFSAANAHALAAFGMTPDYLREARRGFSTFEFRLRFGGPLRPGDLVQVRSAVVHVGNSSLRLLHAMTTARGGDPVAVLDQAGVHLDLEARRPAPLPASLRDRALAMLAPGPAAS